MNSYKIGNKVTAIIRAYSSGNIGDYCIQYGNQPYTIIKTAEVDLSFDDVTSNVKDAYTQLYYNNSKLSKIKISDITLTDKILNLIFLKSETKLATKIENLLSSDEKTIFLSAPQEKIYQVFIYNNNGDLEAAYGELNSTDPLEVKNAEQPYMVCYQYEEVNAISFDQSSNNYYTLDLIITGNKNDGTTNSTVHIEKCGLRIDKSMYFKQESNTVDLVFTVIDTKNNYLTLQ